MNLRSRLVDSVLAHPRWWALVPLGLTLVAALAIPRLALRTDGANLYPDDDPAVVLSREDRLRFYEPQRVILLVEPRHDELRLDSPLGLRRLIELHDEISRWPEVQGIWMRSVATILRPPASPDDRHIRAYLEDLTTDEEWRQGLIDVRADPLTEGLFLSRDGRSAAFYLPLAEPGVVGTERAELMNGLEQRLRQLDGDEFELRLTGPAVAEVRLGEAVLADLAWLVPLLVMVIAVVLALTLRTVGGVLLPLIEVAVVLVWTFAAMAIAGVPLTLTTTILPIVLMAMAVTDEIHLLEALERRLTRGASDLGQNPDPESDPESDRSQSRARALRSALDEVGRPIVLTSLTTAAGFLSFTSASIAPIRHFGLFAAFGLIVAMILSFTLIPALAMLLPERWLRPPRKRSRAGWSRLASAVVRHRTPVFLATAIIAGLLTLGIPRLSIQDSWIDNFDPKAPVVVAGQRFDRAFWGSYRYDVVLDSDERGFFRTPAGLALVEELRSIGAEAPAVAGSVSHLRGLEAVAPSRGVKQPLSSGDPKTLLDLSTLTESVARRIDTRHFLSPDAEAARTMLVVSDADFRKSRALDDYLRPRLDALAARGGLRWHASGDLPLAVSGVEAIVGNQLRSIGWTTAIVFVLLVLALRSPFRAIVSLTPVVAAVAAVLGAMGWLGVPLGIATSMFAALTLGVGVDFAVHTVSSFERRRRSKPDAEALVDTLATVGRALSWNTLTLALGFAALTLSELRPNRNLGWLLAIALIASLIATFGLLPRSLLRRKTPGA